MKPISLSYKPFEYLPYTKQVEATFPQAWSEINNLQLIAIARLYKKSISEIELLHVMTGIPSKIINMLDEYAQLSLFELLGFMSDIQPYHVFIIPSLNLKHPKRVLFCPKPKLKAVTFAQFIFADTYFGNYIEDNNTIDLHKFIAALYLPANTIFDEQYIEQNHSAIKQIEPETCDAIAINYQLIHEWLCVAYPLVFQKYDELTAPSSTAKRDPTMWIKVFRSFVGDDIINDDKWANKPVNTIFEYMTRKTKENIRSRHRK